MAERRMFSKSVVQSDHFLDMPATTQLLYFHLGMSADDDGFVGSPRSVMRIIGASEDDLKLLCAKQYIIPFEAGIILISHWKLNNYIQKDRYHKTIYSDQKALVSIGENGVYTSCIHSGYSLDTQTRLEKTSQGGNPLKGCPSYTRANNAAESAASKGGTSRPKFVPKFPVEDAE